MKADVREMIEHNNSFGERALADADAQLISLKSKIASVEDTLETKISTVCMAKKLLISLLLISVFMKRC